MSEINDLRQRVEAAEERFGLIDEQQRHYSDRLIGLIETIEAQLASARSEIESQIADNQRLQKENEELRSMLHTVLRSIEQKTFTQTLQNLEARVCALVGGAGIEAAPAAPGGAETREAPVKDIATTPLFEAEGEDLEDVATEAFVEAEGSAAMAREAEVILEPASEEAFETEAPEASLEAAPAEDSPAEAGPDDAALQPEGTTEELAAEAVDEMPAASAEELMAQARRAAALAGMGATPADPLPAADDMAGGFEAGTEESGAASFDTPEARWEDPTPSQSDSAAASAPEETDEISAPEDVMGDVTFEDDPAAVAESGTSDAAEMGPEAEAAADLPPAEPETAEAETGSPTDAAFGQSAETATAARGAGSVAAEATPSVKEIIRRVGDLARELEMAEAERRANRRSDEESPDSAAALGDLPQAPPFGQAANG